MKALSVRNLPNDVYEAPKTMATTNHRSMQEQVRCIIEREARLASGLAEADAVSGPELGRYGRRCTAGSRKMMWVICTSSLDVAYNPSSLCEPMRTNCRILPSGFW